MQLVPGRGVRLACHHRKDGLAQCRRHSLRIGRLRCVATLHFADHIGVAKVGQHADQLRAQDRGRIALVRLRFPSHMGKHRLQLLDREGVEARLPRLVAAVVLMQAGEGAGDVAPDLRVGIGRGRLGQVEVARCRLQAGHAQRPGVAHQAHLVDRRQLGEIGLDRRKFGRRVERAVVPALPRIHQHRAAARHVQRGLAVHHRARRLGAADGPGDHRHVPLQRRLVWTILGELALGQGQRGLAVAARGRRHADQRDARLQREVMGDLRHRLAGRALHRLPQIVRHGVAVSVRLDVVAHAVAPGIGADIGLQHVDHCLALGIGDRVERLAGLLHRLDVLHHRMRGGHGVARHRALPGADGVKVGVPFRVQLLGGARGHPRGKALVQPQVVPPAHGHQVAEPLVRHLVRGGVEHLLLVRLGREARIQQQGVFEGVDRAPVLHRGEELAAARRGDVVQLRQRIRHAEIIVVLAQHVTGRLQGETGLRLLAQLRDHADLGAVGHGGGALELAHAEEQQVGRHLRRLPERHAAHAVAQVLLRGDRHVAHRHVGARHGGFEVERGLVRRLVPRGDEAARVGVLELRVQRALLAGLGVVVDREQAVGLGADPAGVAHRQAVFAGRHRVIEGEGGRLRLLVHRHLRLAHHDLQLGRRQRGLGEREARRVERDAAGGLEHVQRDRDLAVETELVGVRHHRHVVVQRRHATRQLGGGLAHRRCLGGGRERGHRQAGQGQRNGGNKIATHDISLANRTRPTHRPTAASRSRKVTLGTPG